MWPMVDANFGALPKFICHFVSAARTKLTGDGFSDSAGIDPVEGGSYATTQSSEFRMPSRPLQTEFRQGAAQGLRCGADEVEELIKHADILKTVNIGRSVRVTTKSILKVAAVGATASEAA